MHSHGHQQYGKEINNKSILYMAIGGICGAFLGLICGILFEGSFFMIGIGAGSGTNIGLALGIRPDKQNR